MSCFLTAATVKLAGSSTAKLGPLLRRSPKLSSFASANGLHSDARGLHSDVKSVFDSAALDSASFGHPATGSTSAASSPGVASGEATLWGHLFRHAEFYARHQEAAAWELALEVGPRSSEASSLRGKGLGLVSRVVRADGGAAAGGAKLLLELSGGQRVETAIIMAADRRRKGGPAATICISSQAGCAMACRFCDTGLMGRPAEATATTAFKEAAAAVANGTPGSSKRNLDVAGGASGGKLNLPTWAILEQVLHAEAWVQREMGRDQGLDAASNIVFMGMGEPLLNYNSVLSASRALCQGSARRKVTLSTVGVTPRIESLTRDFPSGLRLALSLHAPTQELREQLLPVAARAWPLQALMQSVRNFEASTGSGVLIEYILLRGVNDEETHADALADLIAREGLQCAGVNLIPYNPTTAGSSAGYEVPSDARCKAFRARLRSLGTPNVTIRFSTKCGRDSASACGQLGLRSVS